MQNDVDASALGTDVVHHGLDGRPVQHVNLAVEGSTARLLHPAQGFQYAGLPFQIEELLLDLRRRGPALLGLDALEDQALGRLAILDHDF